MILIDQKKNEKRLWRQLQILRIKIDVAECLINEFNTTESKAWQYADGIDCDAGYGLVLRLSEEGVPDDKLKRLLNILKDFKDALPDTKWMDKL
jgi:hypothetical protein